MALTTKDVSKMASERLSGGYEQIKVVGLNGADPIGDLKRAIKGEVQDLNSINHLSPYNHDSIRDSVDARQELFDLSDENDRREYKRRLTEGMNSQIGSTAREELNAYRTFELSNDIMAAPFAMAAFQSVDLSADELPLFKFPQSRNLNRFSVQSVSIDGGFDRNQWRTSHSVSHIEMEYEATDRVQWPILDLQLGNISAERQVIRELEYDMEMRMDERALSNFDAAKTVSGLRALLSVHPKVNTANIPDTNYLDLDTLHSGNTGVWTIEKLKTLLNHIALFGSADGQNPFTIKTIFVSPQNLRDFWDFTDLTYEVSGSEIAPAETVPSAVRDQIFKTGMFTSAWGYTFNWVPNSQIAKGKVRVVTSEPLGWHFTKRSMDKFLQWDESNSPDHAEANMGEAMFKKASRFYVPDLWKHHVLIADL